MEMEDFNRPNHADFMDSSELKKIEFSGLRHNSISDCMEIWVLGERRREVRKGENLAQAFEEVFGIGVVELL